MTRLLWAMFPFFRGNDPYIVVCGVVEVALLIVLVIVLCH